MNSLSPPFFLPISLYFYNFLKPPLLKDVALVPINFPLVFEIDINILSLSSLKKLYFAVVLSSFASIVTLRDHYKKLRAIFYNMISIYIETILICNHELVELLDKNILKLEKKLNLEKGIIDKSREYFEKIDKIKPNYLISLTWSMIAMQNENKKNLNKREMMRLIHIQIELFKKESKILSSYFNKLTAYRKINSLSLFDMILCARVDDACLMKGFSELDYINNIRNFRDDKELLELLSKRGDIIKQISQSKD